MTAASCQHHPDQAAVGVCVQCQARLCAACVTKLDGVNHCHLCLAALADASARPRQSSVAPGVVQSWLGAGLGLGLLSVLTWLMLNALLPSAGPP